MNDDNKPNDNPYSASQHMPKEVYAQWVRLQRELGDKCPICLSGNVIHQEDRHVCIACDFIWAV